MSRILVVNIGSTSLKYQLFEMEDESTRVRGVIERIGDASSPMSYAIGSGNQISTCIDTSCGYDGAIRGMLRVLNEEAGGASCDTPQIKAVGFKTVHAGPVRSPSIVGDEILEAMEDYACVVPIHNPPYIKAIRRFRELLPNVPLVAVFETYFHRDMPDCAYMYSIPYEWYESFGIRKYGFHGASHRYISERVPKLLGRPLDNLKVISCHLGGSSSICAIQDGRSVDTSMGFSTQAGVPMAKRCGDMDPFIIPFIMRKANLSLTDVMERLVEEGGLLGISGISGDVRDLEERYEDNYRARLALDLFAYNVKKHIGSCVAIMNGVDVVTFAGGIGENSIKVREKICLGLEYLGIELDTERNKSCRQECVISSDRSKVKIMVIPTNEEIIVAREALRVVDVDENVSL